MERMERKVDALASSLTARLRDAGLDLLLVTQFAGLKNPMTVADWIKQTQPPRGLRLTSLQVLLYLLDINSPEFVQVTEYGQYLARLVASRVITLEQAREYLDVGHDQAVLETMRGERDPYDTGRNSRKPAFTLEELHELHDTQLLDTEYEWLKRFGRPVPDHKPSDVSQPSLDDMQVPSVAEEVEEAPAAPGNSSAVITTNNDQFLAKAGADFAAVAALARHFVLYGTPEDRERLRALLGEGGMFDFSNDVNALCSERAREETIGA